MLIITAVLPRNRLDPHNLYLFQPVRGIQNGRAVLLPNMCEFKNAQCRANDSRLVSCLKTGSKKAHAP